MIFCFTFKICFLYWVLLPVASLAQVPGAPITLEQQQILASALLKALNADSVSEALSVLQSYTVEREVARKNAFHKKYCGACRRILCLRTYAVSKNCFPCCPPRRSDDSSRAPMHEIKVVDSALVPNYPARLREEPGCDPGS